MSEPAERVTRRTALKLGSGGALALLIGGGAGWLDRRGTDGAAPVGPAPTTTSTTSTTTTTAAPIVIEDIGEVDPAIIALGHRVIELTGEGDLAALLAALPSADGDPLERAGAQVSADFRAGDTIVVDGWILAASEARAAAALALLCDGAC